MPEIKYKIAYWLFGEYGQAVDYCIKNNKSINNIKKEEYKTVAEVEKETGVNYGCQPCIEWNEGRCEGAKPGAFYYPTECPSFSDGNEDEYDEHWDDEEAYNDDFF